MTTIHGGTERHIKFGSKINLTCEVQNYPGKLNYIVWYKNKQVQTIRFLLYFYEYKGQYFEYGCRVGKKPVLKEYPLFFFLVNLSRPRDRCLPSFVLQFSEFDEKAPIQHHVSKQTISNTFLNCHRSRYLTTGIFKF